MTSSARGAWLSNGESSSNNMSAAGDNNFAILRNVRALNSSRLFDADFTNVELRQLTAFNAQPLGAVVQQGVAWALNEDEDDSQDVKPLGGNPHHQQRPTIYINSRGLHPKFSMPTGFDIAPSSSFRIGDTLLSGGGLAGTSSEWQTGWLALSPQSKWRDRKVEDLHGGSANDEEEEDDDEYEREERQGANADIAENAKLAVENQVLRERIGMLHHSISKVQEMRLQADIRLAQLRMRKEMELEKSLSK